MATIFITGASGGLGQVVTQTMLNKGHLVIATRQYSDNPQILIHGFSNLLYNYETDLSDEVQVQSLIQQVIHQHGLIDATILLAGGYARRDGWRRNQAYDNAEFQNGLLRSFTPIFR